MSKVNIYAKGLSCEHCVDKVERFIGEHEGVLSIQVCLNKDLESKITIEHEGVSLELLKEAVLDAGYEVTKIEQ